MKDYTRKKLTLFMSFMMIVAPIQSAVAYESDGIVKVKREPLREYSLTYKATTGDNLINTTGAALSVEDIKLVVSNFETGKLRDRVPLNTTSLEIVEGNLNEADREYITKFLNLETFIMRHNVTNDGGKIWNTKWNYDNNLKEIIWENITKLDDEIFRSCKKLIEVTMPNLEILGARTFFECTSLKEVNFISLKEVAIQAFCECMSLERANMPVLERIKVGGFSRCIMLQEIDFPLLTIIEDEGLEGCSKLNKVSMAQNLSKIGERAFSGTNITTVSQKNHNADVYIPQITEVPRKLFERTRNLKEVDLPYVTKVGWGAFSGCNRLRMVNLENAEIIQGNVFYECTDLSWVSQTNSEADVYIPKSIEFTGSIELDWGGPYGVFTNSGIKKADLPLIENLPHGTFRGCNIETVSQTNKESDIYIPKVKSIGMNVFSRGVKSLSLPYVTLIGEKAFKEIYGVESISQVNESANIYIPSIKHIPQNALCYADKVELPYIESVEKGFIKDAKEIILSGIKVVPTELFGNMSSLQIIDISGSQELQDDVFRESNNILEVKLANVAPTVTVDTFFKFNTENVKFIIPSLEATGYDKSPWDKFNVEVVNMSNNANLKRLTVNKGTLNPSFNTDTLNYTVDVANSVNTITINGLAEDSKAVVEGVGEKVLQIGNNTINVIVTAENGKIIKNYTILVKRSNDSSSSSSSSSSGSNASTSKPSLVEQVIEKLPNKDKETIINNFKEEMPYTSLSRKLTVEQLKKLTNNKFTDKQLQEMLDKPEVLEKLGIDKVILNNQIVLKSVEYANFTDVPDTHWASGPIKLAAQLGLVAGMPNGTFAPKDSLQVADTFTFLDRVLLLNGMTEMKLPRSTVEKYITNKEHWAFANMASIGSKLSEDTLKIVSELGTQPITRGLLAQVLYEITDGKLEETRESIFFIDTQESFYQKGIDYAVKTGLLVGTSEKTMSPEKVLTRAELMTVLIRLDEFLK